MDDRSALCSLPAELKSIIVHLCDDMTLLTLRQAIAGDLDFTQEANKAFGTRFMRERMHFITREGLQTLVGITGHATFGRFLERITLYPFNLSPEWQPRTVSCEQGQRSGKTHVERLNRACEIIWPHWKELVSDFHGKDVSINLLTAALRNLKQHARSVELSIASALQYCDEEIYGGGKLVRRLNEIARQAHSSRLRLEALDFLEVEPHWLGDSDDEKHEETTTPDAIPESDDTVASFGEDLDAVSAERLQGVRLKVFSKPYGPDSPRDPATLVLASLADSGFVPLKLGFDCTDDQCPVPTITTCSPRFFSISAAVAQITKLTFGLSDISIVNSDSRLQGMRHLFSLAIQLKDLEIGCFFMMWRDIPEEDNSHMFELVEDLFNACPLEKVSIQGVLTRPRTFCHFLLHHKGHLRSLDFNSCGFYTTKRFLKFHKWMAEHLKLHHLGLRETWISDDQYERPGSLNDFTINGADWSKEVVVRIEKDETRYHSFAAWGGVLSFK